MTKETSYVFDSESECERLEAQAVIAGIAGHVGHVRAPEKAWILDAGCGSGSMSRVFARRDPQSTVVGVDVNAGYVGYAAAKGRNEGLTNLTFQEADLHDLPFDDHRFDLIWSKYVLCFVPDPATVAGEFFRVIKEGGSVLIVLNDWSRIALYPPDDELHGTLQKVVAGLADVSLPARLPALLTRAGFAEVSVSLEADRVYTCVGQIDQGRRHNHAAEMMAARAHIAATLGSEAAFENFMADWLGYLDRPDTCVVLPLWFVTGIVRSTVASGLAEP